MRAACVYSRGILPIGGFAGSRFNQDPGTYMFVLESVAASEMALKALFKSTSWLWSCE